MRDRNKNRIAGTAGGLINGLFGGGGGMVFLPIQSRWGDLDQRKLYATCVGVIFPVCLVSAAVYLYQVRPALSLVLPYLAGGVAGGVIGGMTFEKVPVRMLKLIFGAFLLYGGVRYLLW